MEPIKACITLTISGKTTQIKEELKNHGFRWHSRRRNWFKFGELTDYEHLKQLAMKIWRERPGQILFDIFSNEHLVESKIYHQKRMFECQAKGETYDDIPF